jgi:hypothetical protein
VTALKNIKRCRRQRLKFFSAVGDGVKKILSDVGDGGKKL